MTTRTGHLGDRDDGRGLTRRATVAGDSTDPALAAAERVARLMDKYHLDPLLGFTVPWAGDLLSAGLGLYPIVLAWRKGAPKGLVARMLLNLSVDVIGGAVPVLGDIWDFFFRAHSRNLQLLKSRLKSGGEVTSSRRDGLVVAGAVVVFLAALAIPIGILVALIGQLAK